MAAASRLPGTCPFCPRSKPDIYEDLSTEGLLAARLPPQNPLVLATRAGRADRKCPRLLRIQSRTGACVFEKIVQHTSSGARGPPLDFMKTAIP